VNSLVKELQVFGRIAKAAVLQDLFPKSMGVSVNASFEYIINLKECFAITLYTFDFECSS
jgi:hypothetical protein